MNRALVWKEWRQQRSVVVAGVGLAAVIPLVAFVGGLASSDRLYFFDVAEMIPFLVAAMIWPLFAAIAGANAHAGDQEAGALGFLLSRPVSRTRVWGAKVVIAAGSVAAIVIGSFVVGQVVYLIFLDRVVRFPFISDPFSNRTMTQASVHACLLGFVALAFAGGLFCSLLTRKPIVAAAGGLGVSFAGTALAILGHDAFSASLGAETGGDVYLYLYFGGVAAVLLGGAHYVFARAAGKAGVDVRRPVLVAVPMMLLATALVAVGSAQAAVRVDYEGATFIDLVEPIPGGNEILLAMTNNEFAGTSLWVAAPGGEPRQLTGRLSARGSNIATIAPDGEWVVYASRIGPLGFRRSTCELRAIRTDGGDDHPIADDVNCSGARAFSEDGTRIAVRVGPDEVDIVSLDGMTPAHRLDRHHLLAEAAAPVSWTNGDRQVVLAGRSSISLVDVVTGDVTIAYAARRDVYRLSVMAATADRLLLRLARVLRDDEGRRSWQYEYLVVELDSGDVIELPDASYTRPGPCPSRTKSLSPDGATVYFTTCDERDPSISRVARFELDSGATTVLGEFDGSVGVEPSADGERVLVSVYKADRDPTRVTYRRFIVSREGTIKELTELGSTGSPNAYYNRDPAWSSVGWSGNDGLVLFRRIYPDPDRDPTRRQHQVAFLDIIDDRLEILAGGRTP